MKRRRRPSNSSSPSKTQETSARRGNPALAAAGAGRRLLVCGRLNGRLPYVSSYRRMRSPSSWMHSPSLTTVQGPRHGPQGTASGRGLTPERLLLPGLGAQRRPGRGPSSRPGPTGTSPPRSARHALANAGGYWFPRPCPASRRANCTRFEIKKPDGGLLQRARRGRPRRHQFRPDPGTTRVATTLRWFLGADPFPVGRPSPRRVFENFIVYQCHIGTFAGWKTTSSTSPWGDLRGRSRASWASPRYGVQLHPAAARPEFLRGAAQWCYDPASYSLPRDAVRLNLTTSGPL